MKHSASALQVERKEARKSQGYSLGVSFQLHKKALRLASKDVTCCPSQVTMAGQAAKHLEEGVQGIVIMQQSGSPSEQAVGNQVQLGPEVQERWGGS